MTGASSNPCSRAWCICAIFCVPLLGLHSAYAHNSPVNKHSALIVDGRITLAGSPVGALAMPAMGFGTCCRKSARGPALISSTLEYLRQGGRLIDTAQMYKNHRDLRIALQRSGVPRGQIWLTSKVNTIKGGLGRQEVGTQVKLILEELGVTYLDLMLLHHAKNNSPSDRIEQFKGLLDAKALGLVRHVGVSNFNRDQLEALRVATGVLPAVNQIEYHPYVAQETHDLVRWCQEQGIAVTAYGSLGSSSTGSKAGTGVAAVATRYGVSSAAVLLRWSLNKGCAVIPGATSATHIYENLHLKPFELTPEDEESIRGRPAPKSWRMWNNMAKDA